MTRQECQIFQLIEKMWPENADAPFVPCPGSPLVIEYSSMVPFAEFVTRKMIVSSVSGLARG